MVAKCSLDWSGRGRHDTESVSRKICESMIGGWKIVGRHSMNSGARFRHQRVDDIIDASLYLAYQEVTKTRIILRGKHMTSRFFVS